MHKYIKHLDKIHMIQKYIEKLAKERSIPLISITALIILSAGASITFDRVRENSAKRS